MLRRNATFQVVGNPANAESPLIISAVLATDTPCRMLLQGEIVDEVLPVANVDLSRISPDLPLPMLFSHNPECLPLGHWRDLRIGERELSAGGLITAKGGFVCGINPNGSQGLIQSVRDVRASILSGSLRGVSVGYDFGGVKVLKPGEHFRGYTATRRTLYALKWILKEASIVPVPADANSSIQVVAA